MAGTGDLLAGQPSCSKSWTQNSLHLQSYRSVITLVKEWIQFPAVVNIHIVLHVYRRWSWHYWLLRHLEDSDPVSLRFRVICQLSLPVVPGQPSRLSWSISTPSLRVCDVYLLIISDDGAGYHYHQVTILLSDLFCLWLAWSFAPKRSRNIHKFRFSNWSDYWPFENIIQVNILRTDLFVALLRRLIRRLIYSSRLLWPAFQDSDDQDYPNLGYLPVKSEFQRYMFFCIRSLRRRRKLSVGFTGSTVTSHQLHHGDTTPEK